MNSSIKQEVINLRKHGESYGEINKKLNISKSTLSYWLKDIEISKEHKMTLREKMRNAGTSALIKRNKNQTLIAMNNAKDIIEKESKTIANIDKEKLKLIGCALYLGEGGKTPNRADFTNSNPEIIKIMMKYFRSICNVKGDKFRIQLSIYDKAKIKETITYWNKITGIPEKQFIKVNLLTSKYSKKRRKNRLPYGTIQVRISDVKLFHKIQGWILGICQKLDMPG